MNSPIHNAAHECDATAVAALLGIDPLLIESRNFCDNTPLHEAARYGCLPVAKLLLDRGANIQARGEQGWSPLHIAGFCGKIQMARFLINRGADLESKDDQGFAPVFVALMGRDFDCEKVATILLRRGASYDLRTAIRRKDVRRVRYLLRADPDALHKVPHPDDALPDAVAFAQSKTIVRLLLEHGADPNAVGPMHTPALILAVSGSHLDPAIVELLIRHGADVNVQYRVVPGAAPETPLQKALAYGTQGMVRILLQHGAEL